jgi:hypothetical protein
MKSDLSGVGWVRSNKKNVLGEDRGSLLGNQAVDCKKD